jgi:hypothetical protein
MMYESGMVSASMELRMGAALSWTVPTLKEAALATAATDKVRTDFMVTKREKRRSDETGVGLPATQGQKTNGQSDVLDRLT